MLSQLNFEGSQNLTVGSATKCKQTKALNVLHRKMKPIVRKPVKIPVSREREGSTRAPTQPNGQLSYKCKHTLKMKIP